MKDTQAAGFCRRFAIAVNSGVDLIAVIRAEARQGPARQRDELAKVAEGMAAGFQMSDVMSESKFWPPLMLSLTRVG
ncbi:MAG: type II secretion system F family protein, partial [Planctomycetota bacterium]